jgi:hypothetical protein
MITRTILVHSSDGIAFRVVTNAKTYEQMQAATLAERKHAAGKTAAELDANGDHERLAWGSVPC